MPRPAALSRSDAPLARRDLLRVLCGTAIGGAAVLSSAGCGTITLGRPERYTPPPPGIDDLYREDLLAVLDRAVLGTERVIASGAPAADATLSGALSDLAAVLPVQRTALLTGAEHERESEAEEDPSAEGTSPPPPADAPEDLAGLVAVLVDLRDLAAAAARQVSGSLARPTVAIAARTAWSAQRLRGGAGPDGVAPSPTAEQLTPTREVPRTDPPSVGAESDYHSTLERAQREEWYAGYVHEVLAARSEDEQREHHLGLAALHRGVAEELGRLAEEDGAPVVARRPVYTIPDGTLDAERVARLPARIAHGLMIDHIALVGAAPFERRPLSIAAALQEAERLAALEDRMEAMPSLEVEDPPVTDG